MRAIGRFRPNLIQALALLLSTVTVGGGLAFGSDGDTHPQAAHALPPVAALGIRLDTLLLGGYTAGSFSEAVHVLASDLSGQERELVGQHLERIFRDELADEGIGRTGRLRVAYERAVRPDGSTRSIRVLGAEIGVAGRLHTAYYFEKGGRPGYFDPFGRAVDGASWQGPLASTRVSSQFAQARMHPILKRMLPHTGVDFAAPTGEPVRATADGMVASAGENGGYGLMIELQHPNGYNTRYAHLSAIGAGVEPARMVRQGDVIGYVGMTGLATGPHLHYEVRRRGQPVDPLGLSADGGLSSSVGGEPRWAQERTHLAALLAATPTVLGQEAAIRMARR